VKVVAAFLALLEALNDDGSEVVIFLPIWKTRTSHLHTTVPNYLNYPSAKEVGFEERENGEG